MLVFSPNQSDYLFQFFNILMVLIKFYYFCGNRIITKSWLIPALKDLLKHAVIPYTFFMLILGPFFWIIIMKYARFYVVMCLVVVPRLLSRFCSWGQKKEKIKYF